MSRRPLFSFGSAVLSLVLISGAAAVTTPAGASSTAAAAAARSTAQAATGRPSTFVATNPQRVLDTSKFRAKYQPKAHGTVHLAVLGHGLVPASGVSSVALTVTVTEPRAHGYLTAYPDGSTRPVTSNLNFRVAQRTSNLVVVAVGADGKVALYNGSAGSVQMLADVSGYYATDTAKRAGSFVATTPTRALDTRTGLGATTPAGGAAAQLPVLGRGTVPSTGVSSVLVNVTVIAPAAGGFLTVYGDGTSRPAHPNVSFEAGQTVPILVVAPVGANGRIAIFNGSSGPVRLVADISGYYLAKAAVRTGTFVAIPPTRLGTGTDFTARETQTLLRPFDSPGPLPLVGVSAVVMNVTVTDPTADGHVSAGANSSVPSVVFSNAHSAANLVIASLASGLVDFTNASNGSVHVDVDVVGYYLASPGRGAISGKVGNSHGVGVSGVRVILFDGGPSEHDEDYGTTTTGADGTYQLSGLWAGMKYLVCFAASGVKTGGYSTVYRSECYRNRVWVGEFQPAIPSDSEPVTVSAGTTTTGIDAYLDEVKVGTIAGTVTDTAGAPLKDVVVFGFFDDVNNEYAPRTRTGADGSYSLGSLPDGPYTVCFEGTFASDGTAPNGYVDQCFRNITWNSNPPDFLLPAGTTSVPVTVGATVSGIDAQLVARAAARSTRHTAHH